MPARRGARPVRGSGQGRAPGRRLGHRRPVRHHHDRRTLGQPSHRVQEHGFGLGVEVCGRLVEEHVGTARRAPRAPARAGPARRRRVPRRPRRAGSRGRRGRAATVCPRSTRSSARHSSSSVAPGRPSRRLSAQVPAVSQGRCGAHATRRPPRLRVGLGQVDAADPDAARRRGEARRPGRPAGSTCRIRRGRRSPSARGRSVRRQAARATVRSPYAEREPVAAAIGPARSGACPGGAVPAARERIGRPPRSSPRPRRRRGTRRRRGAAASRPPGRAAARPARRGSRANRRPAGGRRRPRPARPTGWRPARAPPTRRRRAAACRRWPCGSGR